MKKLLVGLAVATAFTSTALHAEDTRTTRGPFGEEVLWTESQGRVGDRAVIVAPERICPGDLFVDLVKLTLPDPGRGNWEVNAWAEMASNTKAFIVNIDSEYVRLSDDDPLYPPLSADLKPTTEVIVGCMEKAKVSISADEDGEIVFSTHDPELVPVFEKAGVKYVLADNQNE